MNPKQEDSSGQQSCWTCKGLWRDLPRFSICTWTRSNSSSNTVSDRKVRCDESFPTCINCTRARRECVRLAMRLSWPKTKNRRRFITNDQSLSSSEMPGIHRNRTPVFLNTSHWDITLQMELDKKRISRNISLFAFLSGSTKRLQPHTLRRG